jgi:hypothetical protein
MLNRARQGTHPVRCAGSRLGRRIFGEDDAGGLAVQAELVRHLHGKDRMISPELERFMADRMKAKTIEVKASHLSLISHPHEITDLILSAAGSGG